MFPSPLGVIFSLICSGEDLNLLNLDMFPSPLGVIFSLIKDVFLFMKKVFKFPSPLGVIFSLILWYTRIVCQFQDEVSVSSRSYILSYSKKELEFYSRCSTSGFRLLSELFSLLLSLKFQVGL